MVSQNAKAVPKMAALQVRPLHSEDSERLYEMHQRSSLASLTSRYFRPYRPTRSDVAQICQLDRESGAAFVATLEDETIVGLGYYVKSAEQPAAAEMAFLVEDRFQGKGIGRALFERLAHHARAQCVSAFDAYVLSANEPMLRIFRRAGYALRERVSYGTREVRIELSMPQELETCWN